MSRKTVTISYDPDVLGLDIGETLERLSKTPDSRYFNRSIASIGGMLLAERLSEEVVVNKRAAREA